MVKHAQTIRQLLLTNCLSVFDHFAELALKGSIKKNIVYTRNILSISDVWFEWFLIELVSLKPRPQRIILL